ncbi:MAG: L-lactate permease, partial [Aminobacterium colombiense]|nr:L-lactate permease [Aminobacterium colombiense]
MNFLLALLPIAIIIVGMAGLNYSSKVVAPVSWIVALFLGFLVFKSPVEALLLTSWNGFLDGIRIVWLIFAAFTLLIIMVDSKAMDSIKLGLSHVTRDKRLMVLFLAIPFGTFLEGAAGAGAPAALAAPFLVGLGMDPV